MIPLLIILLLKHRRKTKANIPALQKGLWQKLLNSGKTATLMLAAIFSSPILQAQESVLHYNVTHNGDIKGKLLLYQNVEGQSVRIKIESEVKLRMLLLITVKSIEEAIFKDSILIYSSIYRKINGDEKINQKLQTSGVSYSITNKNKTSILPVYPIRYCILSLYYKEPVNISTIYSDNYHQFVEIKKVDSHKYKVIFPNGNYNYYSYQGGICTRVEVNQSFYNLQFILAQ